MEPQETQSIQLLKENIYLSVTQEEQEGKQVLRYNYETDRRTPLALMWSVTFDLLNQQTNHPYSSWLNYYPTIRPELTNEIKEACFLAGYSLGAFFYLEAGERLSYNRSLVGTIESRELPGFNGMIVTKKGMLEDYLPFEEMNQLVHQLQVDYPNATFLNDWIRQGESLERRWKALLLSNWIRFSLTEQVEPEYQRFSDQMCYFIEGMPLEVILELSTTHD